MEGKLSINVSEFPTPICVENWFFIVRRNGLLGPSLTAGCLKLEIQNSKSIINTTPTLGAGSRRIRRFP